MVDQTDISQLLEQIQNALDKMKIEDIAHDLREFSQSHDLLMIRVTYESPDYGCDGLRVFSIDKDSRTHLWREG